MNLIDTETGEKLKGIIEPVTDEDMELLKTSNEFRFDWHLEKSGVLYKIRLYGNQEIIGLISISDIPEEFRIHINLIESSVPNRGKNKKIKNIPGCLISFACRIAFDKGYGGFVSLVPKTQLIDYYRENFGFVQIGRQMAVFMEQSVLLMSKYLGDEEI